MTLPRNAPDPNPLFIKICGLRTAEAVDTCVALQVDAVGFVFAESSPRTIDPAAARDLVERLPPSVEAVGVFRNAPLDTIVAQVAQAGIGTAQLHGSYSDAQVQELESHGLRVIRALSVSEYVRADQPYGRVLIDGDDPGSGAEFPAGLLAGVDLPAEWILAGGLTPGNVARRIRELAPSGVDVSSGVESSRGTKSVELIREFVHEARAS